MKNNVYRITVLVLGLACITFVVFYFIWQVLFINISHPTKNGTGIAITTDHTIYAPNSSIHVTVINMLSVPIYTEDHQINCSILSLQVKQNNNWVPAYINNCTLGIPSMQVVLEAGQTYTRDITNFPPGIYRFVLNYSFEGNFVTNTNKQYTAYSSPIRIFGF